MRQALFWIGCVLLGASIGWGAASTMRGSDVSAPRAEIPVKPAVPGRDGASNASDVSTQRTQPTGSSTAPRQWLTADGAVTAVWANDGEDKVTRDELRTRTGLRPVINRAWDGQSVQLFGAKNEVVSFNLVLEAGRNAASAVTVEFRELTGPDGAKIATAAADPGKVFTWVDRDIELFLVRYLQIKGLSQVSYQTYDERHIPERFQRPVKDGFALGGWNDRPDHDKFYPEIAVPLELQPSFSIAANQNQSIWADIYVPKDARAGDYSGEVLIRENNEIKYRVPVNLKVRNFTLPDRPSAKTMVATSYHEVAKRYTGIAEPPPGSPEDELTKRVLDHQMMIAHRHRISLIDDNGGAETWKEFQPRPEWLPRLSGALFTAAAGYKGPGEGVGNDVFSIGTYGQWHNWWRSITKENLLDATNKWESWFEQNSPTTERFLYLDDESDDYSQMEHWARWMRTNSGPGGKLKSFATADLLLTNKKVPALDITASWFRVGVTNAWDRAVSELRADPRKEFYLYNAQRPASGSFATEDDGVALRELAWGQYKKKIDRWFFWNATYYDDYQGTRGPTNVFKTAQTFGGVPQRDPTVGETSWNYANGDGVLFYPGTDTIFPGESYGVDGPFASLRLKFWRRGIQDVDYLTMAAEVDAAATQAIVDRMVPKVLWEYGASDPADPTWVRAPLSWSSNPDDWEAARAELADIIESRAASR
ncbi:MAG TPA: glycoside hydrolase domain-containing protein [Pseudolabrys sp.]|nr:glycoside hydrolase domain-containing protein [Pseudolabrys sp.]